MSWKLTLKQVEKLKKENAKTLKVTDYKALYYNLKKNYKALEKKYGKLLDYVGIQDEEKKLLREKDNEGKYIHFDVEMGIERTYEVVTDIPALKINEDYWINVDGQEKVKLIDYNISLGIGTVRIWACIDYEGKLYNTLPERVFKTKEQAWKYYSRNYEDKNKRNTPLFTYSEITSGKIGGTNENNNTNSSKVKKE